MFGIGDFSLTDNRGQKWHLHKLTIDLANRNGRSTVYYFGKTKRRDLACGMPRGYEVMYSPRTNMPMLRKSR